MKLYFISILLLILGGILSLFFKEEYKLKFCSIVAGISTFLLSILSFRCLITGTICSKTIEILPIFGGINFVVDTLSAFFILIISLMSLLGIIYAIGYTEPYQNKKMNLNSHCLFLMLLIASMLGVVIVQNSLFFLVVWEIMSLSSFFLVIFEGNKKNVLNAGLKYMVYMHISVIFIIAAFALLNIESGSFNFNDFSAVLSKNSQITNIIFVLALIGFGTKAGLVPLHNWLPDAHPAAPTHISGIMSGIMIKTGIYGILRMIYLIGVPSKLIAYTVLSIAIISALWGVLYAITQHDIKRLLAYHSLENIGIIGIGIGIGLLGLVFENQIMAILGFTGGILHVLNHSIFKMLLFFAAGSVYKKANTRDIELLGGLIKKMPYTGLLFIIGSVAICGLPPFNGFISEFLIYAGMLFGIQEGNNIAVFMTLIISLAALALVGTMAILCFTKVTGIMFLGTPRSEQAQKVDSDVENTMLIPMSILAFFTFIIGFFPQYAIVPVLAPVTMLLKEKSLPTVFNSVVELMSTISLLFFILLVFLIFMIIVRNLINNQNRQHTTWGCGYNRANPRMQYTASSYADLFVSTLKPMFKRISHIKKPKDLFPKEAYYKVEIEDIEEAYIVKPLIKLDEKLLSKFERIQNGNMQQYILFGLIFLIVAIVGLIYLG